MIVEYIDKFKEIQKDLEKSFGEKEPIDYKEILYRTLKTMFSNEEEYSCMPDFERISTIDDGDYQGTLLFLIPEYTYQPDAYFYTKVYYGSCSGCDTLQAISDDYDDNKAVQYVTLALHMIEKMKKN